jgi:WD repeat-containing protein 61
MDSNIRVWDLEKGKLIKSIDATPIEAWTVSLSPDNKTIATGSQNGNINIFNIESGKKEQSFDAQKKSFCMTVCYVSYFSNIEIKSPCGRFLASGSKDGSIFLFDIGTSKLIHTLQGHSMSVRSVKFTNDSQRLLSSSDDKHVRRKTFFTIFKIHVYDVKSGSLIKALSGHSSYVLNLSISPDNHHFASW